MMQQIQKMYRETYIMKKSYEKAIEDSKTDHLSKAVEDMMASFNVAIDDSDFSKLTDNQKNGLEYIDRILDVIETDMMGQVEHLESLKKKLTSHISSIPIEETFVPN